MSPTPRRVRKLEWISSAKKDLRAMPEDIQDIFGQAILDLELGDTPAGARPFGEGVRKEIWKIAEDFDGDTYRAAYTAHFPGAVYVLDVFVKKSKTGIATPKAIKDRVEARFRIAEAHYNATYVTSRKGKKP